jgi:hypothetical protein
VRECTIVCVYFDSKSMQTKTLSNFSKVWFDRLLAQVNFLSDKSISLRFKVSITVLNIKGHLSLQLSLFFSSGLRIMLKWPPIMIGIVSFEHTRINSNKKFDF